MEKPKKKIRPTHHRYAILVAWFLALMTACDRFVDRRARAANDGSWSIAAQTSLAGNENICQ
jgi:hypothetical protein